MYVLPEHYAVHLSTNEFYHRYLGFKPVVIGFCDCEGAHEILMCHGLFAFSPIRPQTAISITLLDLYHCVFERSADAVTAWAAALHTHYRRYGFQVQEERMHSYKGAAGRRMHDTEDPFRKGLSEVIQWLDALRMEEENDLEEVLSTAWSRVNASTVPIETGTPWPISDLPDSLSFISPRVTHNQHLVSDLTKLGAVRSTDSLDPSSCQSEGTTKVKVSPTVGPPETVSSPISTPSPIPTVNNVLDSSGTIDDQWRTGGVPSVTIEDVIDEDEGNWHMDGSTTLHPQISLQDGECDRYLQQLCPACFGGSQFGRPLSLYVHSLRRSRVMTPFQQR
jgi:hypothetical protein